MKTSMASPVPPMELGMSIQDVQRNGYAHGYQGKVTRGICIFPTGKASEKHRAWMASFTEGENDAKKVIDEISDTGFATADGGFVRFGMMANWLDDIGDYIAERHKIGWLVKAQFSVVSQILRSYLMD